MVPRDNGNIYIHIYRQCALRHAICSLICTGMPPSQRVVLVLLLLLLMLRLLVVVVVVMVVVVMVVVVVVLLLLLWLLWLLLLLFRVGTQLRTTRSMGHR